jgi:hypothetical protein
MPPEKPDECDHVFNHNDVCEKCGMKPLRLKRRSVEDRLTELATQVSLLQFRANTRDTEMIGLMDRIRELESLVNL